MKPPNQTSASQPGPISVTGPKAEDLKLGIDVHVDRYVVVRQIDGNTRPPH